MNDFLHPTGSMTDSNSQHITSPERFTLAVAG